MGLAPLAKETPPRELFSGHLWGLIYSFGAASLILAVERLEGPWSLSSMKK